MTDEAITIAMRLIKEALFTFGADGDECIQKLVSVQASFDTADIFRAFHLGLIGGDVAEPLPAHTLGGTAARLNAARRLESGLNIGPFDTPNLLLAMDKAHRSLDGRDADATSPLPIPRRKG